MTWGNCFIDTGKEGANAGYRSFELDAAARPYSSPGTGYLDKAHSLGQNRAPIGNPLLSLFQSAGEKVRSAYSGAMTKMGNSLNPNYGGIASPAYACGGCRGH